MRSQRNIMTLNLKQEPKNLYMFSLFNGFQVNYEAMSGTRSILHKKYDFSCDVFGQRKRSASWPRLTTQNSCDEYLAAFLDIDIKKVINYSLTLRHGSSTSTATT